MHAWAEFYCTRCASLHRIAFKIVAYTKYYQHQPCPEGWQPKTGTVCIHDYAIRVRKGRKRKRGQRILKSTIYCPKDTTMITIVEHLREYIIEYYNAEPPTINIEVDFT